MRTPKNVLLRGPAHCNDSQRKKSLCTGSNCKSATAMKEKLINKVDPYILMWIQPVQFFLCSFTRSEEVMQFSLGFAAICWFACIYRVFVKGLGLADFYMWGCGITFLVGSITACILGPIYMLREWLEK
jgi:hypothetical protein